MQRLRWVMLLLCFTIVTVCLAADAPVAQPPVSPTKAPKIVKKINPKDGAAMVWIPMGDFLMGSSDAQVEALCKDIPGLEDWFFGQKPQHTVNLDGFWMYKYDVTVAQYRKFCAATKRKMPDLANWSKDDHPMVMVSWDDATAYALWAGAALPTEAQWEKAARGPDGRIYPWGNQWDLTKCANGVNSNNVKGYIVGPWSVGSFPEDVSPYGCMDMAGNVCQWCADWYDKNYYQNSPLKNPTGPAIGTMRVMRGGCWLYNPGFCRTAFRGVSDPDSQVGTIGFRCTLRSPGP